jgi:HAMP domain-containing protein
MFLFVVIGAVLAGGLAWAAYKWNERRRERLWIEGRVRALKGERE